MLVWSSLLFNSLWVLAVSSALAAFCHAVWAASTQGSVRLNQLLARSDYRRVFMLSGALFCLGMAGMAGEIWQRVAWGMLVAAFISIAWMYKR